MSQPEVGCLPTRLKLIWRMNGCMMNCMSIRLNLYGNESWVEAPKRKSLQEIRDNLRINSISENIREISFLTMRPYWYRILLPVLFRILYENKLGKS